MHDACALIVCVPACNEAEYIVRCVRALIEQYDASGSSLDPNRFEIAVFVNNSNDGTAALLHAFLATIDEHRVYICERTLPDVQANVGTARRLLFEYAAARFRTHGREGYVATTDADTVVCANWVETTLDAFAAGADAVCGYIAVCPNEYAALPLATQHIIAAERRYRMLLTRLQARLDPHSGETWPFHYHHTAASLAVRTSALRTCGGMPQVATHEDVALIRALRFGDARIVHSFSPWVTTSARYQARAHDGMGARLAEWNALAAGIDDITVRSPDEDVFRISSRALLRAAWSGRSTNSAAASTELAVRSGQSRSDIVSMLGASLPFGRIADVYATQLRRHRKSMYAYVPIRSAIDRLLAMHTTERYDLSEAFDTRPAGARFHRNDAAEISAIS